MAGAILTIPAQGGIAKVRWRCAGISEEVVATFGWVLDSQSPIASSNVNERPDTAAESWSDAWTGAFGAGSLQADWSFVGCDISYWPDGQTAGGTPVPPLVGSHTVSVSGSGGWHSVPANCALLVEKHTSLAGRVGKGRAYLPGGYISAGEVAAAGNISSAAQAGANAQLATLLTNLGDDAVRIFLRLFHGQRHHGADVIGPGVEASEVTGLTVDPRVATQRRRMHR